MPRQKRILKQAVGAVVAAVLLTYGHTKDSVDSGQAAAAAQEEIPKPNENAYVGITRCSACHYKEYQSWKASPHGKTFDYLPRKYRRNAECLGCHSGHHVRLALEKDPNANLTGLTGIGCEDCHGPGREHANAALSYLQQQAEFTDEIVKLLRSKIKRTSLDQCIQCHLSKAHKTHPPYDRDEGTENLPEDLRRFGNRRLVPGH